MRAAFRAVLVGVLILVAATLVAGIASLYSWGGRVETLVLLFGDRVWVTVDAGRPRFLLMLLVPAVFALTALSVYRRSND
jgi:hypothetical protein